MSAALSDKEARGESRSCERLTSHRLEVMLALLVDRCISQTNINRLTQRGKRSQLKFTRVKVQYLHVKVRSSKYCFGILNILVIAKAKALLWEEGHSG